MGYDNSASSARQLEARFERLLLLIGDLQAAIGRLQQPAYNPAGGQGGSSGGGVYEVTAANAVVIAAGSSATVTYSQRTGAGVTTIGSAVCYNDMQQPSVTGKTMIVGLNSDGTLLLIDQSC
ncbi:MAG: hypothetical protein ACLQIB_21865 [Isosphaeraceae bacterium]